MNNNPFDHYSEKVFWLFALSTAISILAVAGAFYFQFIVKDTPETITIDCRAFLEEKEIQIKPSEEGTFIFWLG